MNIPSIGFGTYKLGPTETYELCIEALRIGYRHIDTAQLYKNEKNVGEAIRDSNISRKSIFVTTKISLENIKKGNIVDSLEKSINDLDIDYVDLVLLHAPLSLTDANVESSAVANVESWKILVNFQKQHNNLVKFIGVSNYNETNLREIIKICSPYCNQIEISPFLQRKSLVIFCKKENIKIVAHSSLTKGRKLSDPTLENISDTLGATPAQVLLIWAIANDITVLPRSKTIAHVAQNYECLLFLKNGKVCLTQCFKKLDQLDCDFATHPQWI